MDNREQPVGKQWRWYTTTSGIWQTVYLEPRGADPHPLLPHLHQYSRRHREVCARMHCRESRDQVEIEVTSPAATQQRTSLEVQDGAADQIVKLNTVRFGTQTPPIFMTWKCDCAAASRYLDTVRTYFGVRKIDFEFAQGIRRAHGAATERSPSLSARCALPILLPGWRLYGFIG